MDLTLTHHYSKFKSEFEELSIIFVICEFAHSTTIFLCISNLLMMSLGIVKVKIVKCGVNEEDVC